MPSRKCETERKGNAPVNTSPSTNSDGRVPPGNHHPFIAREAIRKKPPRATVTVTNKTPDFVRALPPIMCPRTMCSLPKKLQK
ncbi:hypothetical protein T09_5140 [Trichinella sp. T9]|nr:hypothetical protein T09_5140 [Trichinella sp. T9]